MIDTVRKQAKCSAAEAVKAHFDALRSGTGAAAEEEAAQASSAAARAEVETAQLEMLDAETALAEMDLRLYKKVPLGTRGHSLQEFGQDYSVTHHTCSVDAQSSNGEKHTGYSEWQSAYGISHGKETRRSHGPSYHESRTADIYTNQTGPTQ